MLKKLSYLLVITVVLHFGAGIAISKVKVADGVFIDAYFRPRLELNALDFNSKTGFDSYSTFRTRVGFYLENIIENTTMRLDIADSRSMGFNDPYLQGTPVAPNKSDQNLGVDICYLETREFLRQGTMFRIGRMENNQGRERLFGPGNWSVFGPRTYDGVKFGCENDKMTWHFWSLYGRYGDRHWYYNLGDTPEDAPTDAVDYKLDHTLNGIDLKLKPLALKGTLDLLLFLDLNQSLVNDNVHSEKNVAWSRWTMAGYYNHKAEGKSGVSLDLDAAYQFGSKGLSTGNADIAAYMVFIDAAYKFDMLYKPTAGIGFDFVSGDNSADPLKVNNFYEYYYSAHTFQGHMDLFTGTAAIKNYGLQDFILRLGFSPLQNLKCKLDLHYFKTEFGYHFNDNGYSSIITGNKAKELGWETDITTDWDIKKGLKMRLGYDFFIPSEDWQGEDSDIGTFIYCELTGTI